MAPENYILNVTVTNNIIFNSQLNAIECVTGCTGTVFWWSGSLGTSEYCALTSGY